VKSVMEISQIIRLLKSRIAAIALAVLLGAAAAGAYGVFFVKPAYEASAQLILTDDHRQGTTDYNTLLANGLLIDTYRGIVRLPGFMAKVLRDHPEIRGTERQLLSNVSTETTGSQILTVVARDATYEQARRIANAVAGALVREIPAVMGLNNIEWLNPAPEQAKPVPVKPKPAADAAIGGLLALLLTVAALLVREHLRDDFRSAAEFEQGTGVAVLASYPRMKKSERYPVIRRMNEQEKARERLDVAMEP